MKIWKAILIGQIFVNVPAVAIMLAALFVWTFLIPWEFALFGGTLLAWIWWSYSVRWWRNWAVGRGSDPDRLQKFGVRTGLTWPRGWPLERTEFDDKK